MKRYSITSLVSVLVTCIGLADEPKLGDSFALDKAVRFVFVNEVSVDGGFAYEEKKLKGETKGLLAESLKKVSQQPYLTEPDYTFVGILAQVMLLDSNADPICAMHVVNTNRTVVFCGVTRKNGENMADDRYANIKSDFLARWVYDQLRTKDPAELKRKQELYKRTDRSLESLLFPKLRNSEQVGADQPATAPESESEGKKKSKTESEERPR